MDGSSAFCKEDTSRTKKRNRNGLSVSATGTITKLLFGRPVPALANNFLNESSGNFLHGRSESCTLSLPM
jgi:hypothetical protein